MGYSPRGHKESDTTERLHFHFHRLVGGKNSRIKKEEKNSKYLHINGNNF